MALITFRYSNVGAIVGGVIGGVVGGLAIALLLLFFRRRSRLHKQQQREKNNVDLLNDDDEEGEEHNNGRPAELPHYYQPEPFVVPEPSSHSESGHMSTSYAPTSRSDTPDMLSAMGPSSTRTGKSASGPRLLRPVNIIQHDDAGPSEGVKEEEGPETIELPPAYHKLHRTDSGTPVARPGGAAEATSPGGAGSTTEGTSSA